MKKILCGILVLISLNSPAFAASFVIDPVQMSDLREQRTELGNNVKKLDEIARKIDTAQTAKNNANIDIRTQEQASNVARAALERLQKMDRDEPGSITPEKMREVSVRNKAAFDGLRAAKEAYTNADIQIGNENNNASKQYAEILRLLKSFDREVDRVVEAELQVRIKAMQITKQVRVTERVACGDDSIPVCKERSKKAAERKASEQGSTVFLNSFTEVRNFRLTQDQVRSEVSATLNDVEFSNQHMVGEAEYETTVTATVIPTISASLRKQMADSVRDEVYSQVGGKLDMSRVKNPDNSVPPPPPPPIQPPVVPPYIQPRQGETRGCVPSRRVKCPPPAAACTPSRGHPCPSQT
jgi:hypothetical protein